MDVLVNGLTKNKTMSFISFGSCALDHGAWNCLERALRVPPQDGPNRLSISSLELPHGNGGVRVVMSFLDSLPHLAPSIVHVQMRTRLDEEENKLLLHAVKKKKTLLSFTTTLRSCASIKTPYEKEIAFYFKLNCFGRRILDYTNVRSSLWPIILGRMASDQKDVDAMFFFLR
jgi:hypothetical protein